MYVRTYLRITQLRGKQEGCEYYQPSYYVPSYSLAVCHMLRNQQKDEKSKRKRVKE
jgi:hypothetical protein